LFSAGTAGCAAVGSGAGVGDFNTLSGADVAGVSDAGTAVGCAGAALPATADSAGAVAGSGKGAICAGSGVAARGCVEAAADPAGTEGGAGSAAATGSVALVDALKGSAPGVGAGWGALPATSGRGGFAGKLIGCFAADVVSGAFAGSASGRGSAGVSLGVGAGTAGDSLGGAGLTCSLFCFSLIASLAAATRLLAAFAASTTLAPSGSDMTTPGTAFGSAGGALVLAPGFAFWHTMSFTMTSSGPTKLPADSSVRQLINFGSWA